MSKPVVEVESKNVRLRILKGLEGKISLHVTVRGRSNPHHKSFMEKVMSDGFTPDTAGGMAAMVAEHIASKGDFLIDPSEAYREAKEGFKKLMLTISQNESLAKTLALRTKSQWEDVG